MVEASESSIDDDALVISNGFRMACDADTRQVLNVMAGKKTQSSLVGLIFYVVPSKWMARAWPMLSAWPMSNGPDNGKDDKWREKVGKIQNAQLLSGDHAISSSDEEGVHDDWKISKPPELQMPRLSLGLSHGVDYFLLGPNAWLLLKEKFGTDSTELGRPCVFHTSEESTLAVSIDRDPQNVASSETNVPKRQTRLIPVPPAGHFNYAKLIKDLEGESHKVFPPIANRVHPQQQLLLESNNRKHSDVVSDEDGELRDLVHEGNDDMFLGEESDARVRAARQVNGTQNVLLLLPPSTKAAANTNKSEGLSYPKVPDVERDLKDDEASHPEIGGNDVAAATVVTATAKNLNRYGSGLGNLGNTCFMNSTLQCLAHTYPLRSYFLSGEYERHLNKDNPLGTGGELASHFAQLLAEMWGSPSPSCPPLKAVLTSHVSSSSSVVYPRNFKYTLGKHAEQFMGYDQHDSQELATYLLDALHEDTNRVTTKPYVEKPEKGEDEPDEIAARKAWDLHLKREDSRVLEMFMGQVKSRVQCCKEGCGRVSTTFDPFMYLSVPIPGSTERTMRVTFVPLDPQQRNQNVTVTLSRSATVGKLVSKVAEQLMKVGFSSAGGQPLSLDELCPCDVWSHDVYSWHGADDGIDKIRETDETAIYQVRPTFEIRRMDDVATNDTAEDENIVESLEGYYRPVRYKVDAGTSVQLGRGDEWKGALEDYLVMPRTQLLKMLNPRRGTNTERYNLFQKLDKFVVACVQEADKASNKRAREEDNEDDSTSGTYEQTILAENECVVLTPEEDNVTALIKASQASPIFTNVKTRFDLAVLEYCVTKLRRMILESAKSSRKKSQEGQMIQITCRRSPAIGSNSYSSSQDKAFVNPLVLRIPTTMTVYGLREELSNRFTRSLRLQYRAHQEHRVNADKVFPCRSDVIPMEAVSGGDDKTLAVADSMTVSLGPVFFSGDPALQVIRQIPLSYRKKTAAYSQNKTSKRLGSLSRGCSEGAQPISLASPSDESEKELVADYVGNRGTVFLDWPEQLCDQYFDETEFEFSEDLKDPELTTALKNRKPNRSTTVLDCVEKYCQMEQLEETEMWYCNRCKEHVRAWKQFHLYCAPSILIIHLKRFQYSASTHRRDKISTFIDFPLTGLDLSEIVMHFAEGEKPIFDCYAVSNHYGGLGGGHYTAYALNDNGIWCHYDDSRITENVDPKEVVSEAAYVVYYRRRDVAVGGDLLEDLGAPAIVADHEIVDNERTLSDSSSTQVQGVDMDLEDIHGTADSDSRASSSASPVGPDQDSYGVEMSYHDSEKAKDDSSKGYPLQ